MGGSNSSSNSLNSPSLPPYQLPYQPYQPPLYPPPLNPHSTHSLPPSSQPSPISTLTPPPPPSQVRQAVDLLCRAATYWRSLDDVRDNPLFNGNGTGVGSSVAPSPSPLTQRCQLLMRFGTEGRNGLIQLCAAAAKNFGTFPLVIINTPTPILIISSY